MVSKLPDAFLIRMRQMLGFESDELFESLKNNDSYKGLRVNTLKISSNDFLKQAPWNMEPVPWVKNAWYCEKGSSPASHPMYRAGLYYLQEPSAMTPADRFPAEPGDRVLDMCAAPGGKATALAEKLKGRGLLIANEVNASRAKALLYNMEVFGVTNAVVTNERPSDLEKRFPGFFDKILVDAPCSGEGMFRKEEQAALTWSLEKVEKCAQIQRGLLDSAVKMLRPGGMLMYSTCTFSTLENEENVCGVLERYPFMHLTAIEGYEGFSHGIPLGREYDGELKKTVRIWPHKMKGEGHFLALFTKEESAGEEARGMKTLKVQRPGKEEMKYILDFFGQREPESGQGMLECRGGRAFFVPVLPESVRGIRFLRSGLYLGDLKKNRFEPSQALAMALKRGSYPYCVDLTDEQDKAVRYLNGENIESAAAEAFPDKSWVLVTICGSGLGWCKKNGKILKNKYLWRRT